MCNTPSLCLFIIAIINIKVITGSAKTTIPETNTKSATNKVFISSLLSENQIQQCLPPCQLFSLAFKERSASWQN
jgi:hypothetical protein